MGNPRLKDITGEVFHKWTVIAKQGNTPRGAAIWTCRCECGVERGVIGADLRNNKSKGCGTCYERKSPVRIGKTGHGMSKTRMYNIWLLMKARCKDKGNKNYGARGILYCEEWNDFTKFRDWAVAAGYEDFLTLDRINVNDGYHPLNCRWADAETQSANRNYTHKAPDGELYWHKARANGVTRASYEWRKAQGWDWDKITNTPPRFRTDGYNRGALGRFAAK